MTVFSHMKKNGIEGRKIDRAFVEKMGGTYAVNVLKCVAWLEARMAEGMTLQDAYDNRPFYCMPAINGEIREVDASVDEWIAAKSVIKTDNAHAEGAN